MFINLIVMAQEINSFSDYMQFADDLKQIKKMIKSEDYVAIDIGYYLPNRTWVDLYRYDFPRFVYDNRSWVVRWRIARLQCQYPRFFVHAFYTYYDKKSGFDPVKKELLNKIVNHFTQIRKIERALEQHEKSCRYLLMVTPKEEQIKQSLLAKKSWRVSELQTLINKYHEKY